MSLPPEKTLDITEFRKHVRALAYRLFDNKPISLSDPATSPPHEVTAIIEVPFSSENLEVIPARKGAYLQVYLWLDLSNTPLAFLPIVYESECIHGTSRALLADGHVQQCEACIHLSERSNF
jgi:hypothetical protein